MVEDKEQRIETLQDRVDELEATVSKMLPSRRDALKLGAAGAVGAVGMAGSASAQNSNQVGTIGTDSDRVDVNAEDIDAVSVSTDVASIGAGDVETRTLSISTSTSDIFTVSSGNSGGMAIITLTGDFDRAALKKAYFAQPLSTFNSSIETVFTSPAGGITLNWNGNTLEVTGGDSSSNQINVTVISQQDPVSWA